MKARRTFQIASAMLALIYAVVLIAVTVMILLPLFGCNIMEPFNDWAQKIDANIVSKVSFLPQDGPWGGVAVAAVMLFLPAILMFFAMLILFTKPHNGKQGFHIFGSILGLLGILLFVVLVELCAADLFGDKKITFMIACGAAGVFLILFLLLGMILKDKNKQVAETEQTNDSVSDAPVLQADVAADTTIHTDTTDRIWVAEPESTPYVVNEEQTPATNAQPAEYVPDDTKTVRDIVDRTYGAPLENISAKNLEKIQTLRSLLDANAITKDEYIALVNSYLGIKPER